MGTIIKAVVSLRKVVLSNIATTTAVLIVVVAIALMETRHIFL
jgi:hypothetical protein